MKRLLICILVTFVLAMGLFSCSNDGANRETSAPTEPQIQETEKSAEDNGTEEVECVHYWGEWEITLNPACEKDGTLKRVCENCQAYEESVISALGHAEVSHDAKEPTCTEIGWDE